MLPEIRISPSFYIALAVQILLLPVNWIIAAIFSAAFHELSHLLVLQLCSVPVYRLQLHAFGAELDTSPMEPSEELLCSLAGPAGSFLLMLVIRWFPRIAICALVQGLFNLLPIGKLDGSRVVHSAIHLLPRKSPCKRDKLGVQ